MRRFVVFGALGVIISIGAWVVTASAGSTRLVAGMTGEKEVDAEGNTGAGDLSGRGRAVVRVNVDAGRACFKLSWRGILAPTMSHIHEGDATVAGPPVVTFFMTGDEAQGNDQDLPDTFRSVGGCATGVDKALLRRIRNNPADFYVNVHNDDFPGGAVRGQLHR